MTQIWTRRVATAALVVIIGLSGLHACAQETHAKPAKARAGEISLLGIRLYDSVISVIDRFGNPDSVQPINFAADMNGNNGNSNSNPSGPGFGSGGPGPTHNLPPVGPGGPSGFGGPSNTSGGSADSGNSARQTRLIYLRKGITYNFIINDKGRVVQISSVADKDTNTRTRRGITLGSTYKDVIKRYGYPELHDFQGNSIITLRYLKYQHVAFQLFNQKVVGITVATGTQ